VSYVRKDARRGYAASYPALPLSGLIPFTDHTNDKDRLGAIWISGVLTDIRSNERGDMFNLRDVLDMAIQIERNGESVYRKALARTEDPELVEMLTWMAAEEARHAGHFSDIRQKLTLEVENILMDELGKLMLESIVGNRSFSLEEVDFAKIEEVNDLLKIMITFEKDTVEFYRLFRNLLADAAEQASLDDIIADEEQHIRKLEECRDQNLACHRL
jgi:rubrerythrin